MKRGGLVKHLWFGMETMAVMTDRLKRREWSYLVGRWQDKRDGT